VPKKQARRNNPHPLCFSLLLAISQGSVQSRTLCWCSSLAMLMTIATRSTRTRLIAIPISTFPSLRCSLSKRKSVKSSSRGSQGPVERLSFPPLSRKSRKSRRSLAAEKRRPAVPPRPTHPLSRLHRECLHPRDLN